MHTLILPPLLWLLCYTEITWLEPCKLPSYPLPPAELLVNAASTSGQRGTEFQTIELQTCCNARSVWCTHANAVARSPITTKTWNLWIWTPSWCLISWWCFKDMFPPVSYILDHIRIILVVPPSISEGWRQTMQSGRLGFAAAQQHMTDEGRNLTSESLIPLKTGWSRSILLLLSYSCCAFDTCCSFVE